MSRTILIGDLHGCYEETVALLKKCDVSARDWVIFLGDYVDRGPENAKCCDLVRHREQVQGKAAGILGNHEEKHLDHEECVRRKGRLPEQTPLTHLATRAQLKPEHYEWFRTLPFFLRIPEHNAVAVHAGVFPGRTIEEQKARHLLHIQMIKPWSVSEDGTKRWLYKDGELHEKSIWPSRVPPGEEGWAFWHHFWDGPEFVIFGHSVMDRPLLTDKVAGIDGGAVFGRALHALVLDGDTRSIVTVYGQTDYGKGSRGVQNKSIMTYEIHPGVFMYS
mgnify:CR=1 FL=1